MTLSDKELKDILVRYFRGLGHKVKRMKSPDLKIESKGQQKEIEVEPNIHDYNHPDEYCDEIWTQEAENTIEYKGIKVVEIPTFVFELNRINNLSRYPQRWKEKRFYDLREELRSGNLNDNEIKKQAENVGLCFSVDLEYYENKYVVRKHLKSQKCLALLTDTYLVCPNCGVEFQDKSKFKHKIKG